MRYEILRKSLSEEGKKYLQDWSLNFFKSPSSGANLTFQDFADNNLNAQQHHEKLFPSTATPNENVASLIEIFEEAADVSNNSPMGMLNIANTPFFSLLDSDKVVKSIVNADPYDLSKLEDSFYRHPNHFGFFKKINANLRVLNGSALNEEGLLLPETKQKATENVEKQVENNLSYVKKGSGDDNDEHFFDAQSNLKRLYEHPFSNDRDREKIQEHYINYDVPDVAPDYMANEIKNPELLKRAVNNSWLSRMEGNPYLSKEMVQSKIDDYLASGHPSWLPGWTVKHLDERHIEPLIATNAIKNMPLGALAAAHVSDEGFKKLVTNHPDFIQGKEWKYAPYLASRMPDTYNEIKKGMQVEIHPNVDNLKRIKGALLDSGKVKMRKGDMAKLGLNIPNEVVSPQGEISIDSVNRAVDLLPKDKYNVSFSEWTGSQTHDPNPVQHVFQLNLTNDHVKKLKEQGLYDTFQKMAEISKRSGHPVDYHSLGWARVDLSHPGHAHIDEIQSDLGQGLVKTVQTAKEEGTLPQEYKDLDPEKLQQIEQVLKGNHEDINHAIFSAAHEVLRQKFPDVKTVSMDTPEDQIEQSGLDTSKPIPVHAIKTYKERPRKAGYKEVAKEAAMPSPQTPTSYDDLEEIFTRLKYPSDVHSFLNELHNHLKNIPIKKIPHIAYASGYQMVGAHDNVPLNEKAVKEAHRMTGIDDPDFGFKIANLYNYSSMYEGDKLKSTPVTKDDFKLSPISKWSDNQKVQMTKLVKALYDQMETLKKSVVKPEWTTPDLDNPALLMIFSIRRGIK